MKRSRTTAVQETTTSRPLPPEQLRVTPFDEDAALFVPAPEALLWIRETFIESIHGSVLHNEEHMHLAMAKLGVLWTNAENARHGRTIIGTAEVPTIQGNRWLRGRMFQQLREWFGETPDFLITLSAPYAAQAGDAEFCALVEHELYHCAQKLDAYQCPAFSKETGVPLWAIRGHDVEQFTGIVRRYGADAAGVRALVEAAKEHEAHPVFPATAIAGACGTCLVRAA